MRGIWNGLRREPVLFIASGAALVSAFFSPLGWGAFQTIDWNVLATLFCLMLVVAGLIRAGVFDAAATQILRTTRSTKRVAGLLVNLTFFSAMLVTNDVALLTLVPFTIGLFGTKHQKQLIFLIVLETIAANLGSMLTPVGNPQNLYLYTTYQMGLGTFLKTILPFGVISWLLIMGALLLWRPEPVPFSQDIQAVHLDRPRVILFSLLFVLCLLSVLRVLDIRICLVISVLCIVIEDRTLFAKVDYKLLLTFVAFFVFVGNLSAIPAVRKMLSAWIAGHELWLGILLSQGVSNVPAAVMLSKFTQGAEPLLVGVNLGGLGTLVASLASLISYQIYTKSIDARARQYLGVFTALNLVFLLVLAGVAWLVFSI